LKRFFSAIQGKIKTKTPLYINLRNGFPKLPPEIMGTKQSVVDEKGNGFLLFFTAKK